MTYPFHPISGDLRYTITREFCGYKRKRYVARFCGDWIGQDKYLSGAKMLCLGHCDKRLAPSDPDTPLPLGYMQQRGAA